MALTRTVKTGYKFLGQVTEEMAAAPHTDLFPDRYKEHVAYALGMVARHGFLESLAAIAAVCGPERASHSNKDFFRPSA